MNYRYLTKSRFITAINCPTKLFYLGKKEYRNINNEDSFLASLAQGGYQVGALAKFLFKNGIEIVDKSHEASIKITEELLKKDNVVIYEAAIKFNNFFIRVDILEKKVINSEYMKQKLNHTILSCQTWKVRGEALNLNT